MSKGINVLSLFDGISCGQIALEKAGVRVDNYFASEVDKQAIIVTSSNYPETKQLGCVETVNSVDLPKIDLLIGGSPCQDLSQCKKDGDGLNGSRSGLFWEYVRVLKDVKPTFFLLENVVMKKEWSDIISEELGVEPIEINSNLVSAQNRRRLYWTNIPNIGLPKNKNVVIKDIFDFEYSDRVYVDKSRIKKSWETKNYIQYDLSGKGHKSQDQRGYYINCKHGTLPSTGGSSKVKTVLENGDIASLTPLECERLQTVPDNYTEKISNAQRFKVLGNGWTVDVVAHIFKNIKNQIL